MEREGRRLKGRRPFCVLRGCSSSDEVWSACRTSMKTASAFLRDARLGRRFQILTNIVARGRAICLRYEHDLTAYSDVRVRVAERFSNAVSY